jgi:hypothetical protein
MTEYKTLRVPVEAWHDAQQSKQDSETWGEFLQRCSDNPPTTRKFVELDDVQSASDGKETVRLESTQIDAIARGIVERLR